MQYSLVYILMLRIEVLLHDGLQRQRSIFTLQTVCSSQSDKELDLALTAIQGKVQGVKSALTSFVGKIEHDPQLKW